MGFLETLRGGSNKDGMRETTSLTMAYLLEQNARFEAFMQQKVEALEAIVAQQQARSSAVQGQPPQEGEETWPEPETVAVEPPDEFERPFPDSDLTDGPGPEETQPVPTVGQFVLDDVISSGDEPLPPVAKASGGERTESIEPVPVAHPVMESNEPAQPLDWQAMLLGRPDEKTDEAATAPALGEDLSTEAAESSATQAEEQSDGSDLVLHSLRQQQEIVAGEEMKGNEDSGQASATKTVLALPQDDKVEAAEEEQAVLPAEVVGDDEAWDTSLEQTGPVEEWA